MSFNPIKRFINLNSGKDESSKINSNKKLGNKPFFCILNILEASSQKENFTRCLKCNKTVCAPCLKYCHSNCEEKTAFNLKNTRNFLVYEFASTCYCSHSNIKSSYNNIISNSKISESKEDNYKIDKEYSFLKGCHFLNFFPEDYNQSTLASCDEPFINEFNDENNELNSFFDKKKNLNTKCNYNPLSNKPELINRKTNSFYLCYFCREFCSNTIHNYKNENKSEYNYFYEDSSNLDNKEYTNSEKAKQLFRKSCDCKENHLELDLEVFLEFILRTYDPINYPVDLIKLIPILIESEEMKITKELQFLSRNAFLREKYLKIVLFVLIFKNKPIDKDIEKQLMNYLIEKLKDTKKKNFENEEINSFLTYIYNFYQKTLFSNIFALNIYNIRSISSKNRIKFVQKNKSIFKKIKAYYNDNDGFFSIDKILGIFETLLKLNDYCIFNDKGLTYGIGSPFLTYLLKKFIRTFCFEKYELEKFEEFLLKIEYKPYQFEYNALIRKDLDEIIYLIQIQKIDHYYYSKKDNIEQIIHNPSELYEEFFFYQRNDIFKFYFKKLFSEQNIYIDNQEEEKRVIRENKNIEQYLSKHFINFIDDSINYLDCFHFNFMKNTSVHCLIEDFINSILNYTHENIDKSDSLKEILNIELNCIQSKPTEIIYYRDYRILSFLNSDLQKKEFKKILKIILKQCGIIACDIKVDQRENFLNYLFKSTKFNKEINEEESCIFKSVKLLVKKSFNYRANINSNKSNKNFNSKKNYFFNNKDELDINEFLIDNKETETIKLIDLKKINLKSFEEELKYIFYKLFVLEYYLDPDIFSEECLFEWNILLFFFLSNYANVDFILNKINIFHFIFKTRKLIDNKTRSFLITSLLNNGKQSFFTWKFFYSLFKYFINKNESFFHLKQSIVKYFINSILDFYIIKKPDEIFSENDINHSLTYFFLKILKKLIVFNNLDSCYPYNFNLNKFETLEKINNIAEVVFMNKEFNIKKYLSSLNLKELKKNTATVNYEDSKNLGKSVTFLEDESKRNLLINDKNSAIDIDKTKLLEKRDVGLFENSSSRDFMEMTIIDKTKNCKKLCISKDYSIENIQYILLDLLGNFYTTPNINVYYNIINCNILNFIDFFKNKSPFINKRTYKNKKIFKLEMTILKFLMNFLTIKHYDFSDINLVSDIDLTKEEFYDLGVREDLSHYSENVENKNVSIKSKFLIKILRLEILELLKNFIENTVSRKINDNLNIENNDDNYDERSNSKKEIECYSEKNHETDNIRSDCNRKVIIGLFLADKLAILLKYIYLKEEKNKVLYDYKMKFFDVLHTFFSDRSIMFYFDNIISFEIKNRTEIKLNKHETRKDNQTKLFEEYINKFSDIFEKLSSSAYFKKDFKIDKYFKLIPSFTGMRLNKEGSKFIEEYIKYDDKPESIFSSKLNDHIENLKLLFETKLKNSKTVKIETNFDMKEKKNSLLNVLKKLNNLKWDFKNFKNDKYTSDEVPDMMKYFFKYLRILLNMNSEFIPSIFNSFFNENFLKIINYFNNILYYSPSDIKQYLHDRLEFDHLKILLQNLIKINNYIIGISEYENDKNLISLSKIYYILMDFFILLGEGIHEGKILDIFFMELFTNEVQNQDFKNYQNTVVNYEYNQNNKKEDSDLKIVSYFQSKPNNIDKEGFVKENSNKINRNSIQQKVYINSEENKKESGINKNGNIGQNFKNNQYKNNCGTKNNNKDNNKQYLNCVNQQILNKKIIDSNDDNNNEINIFRQSNSKLLRTLTFNPLEESATVFGLNNTILDKNSYIVNSLSYLELKKILDDNKKKIADVISSLENEKINLNKYKNVSKKLLEVILEKNISNIILETLLSTCEKIEHQKINTLFLSCEENLEKEKELYLELYIQIFNLTKIFYQLLIKLSENVKNNNNKDDENFKYFIEILNENAQNFCSHLKDLLNRKQSQANKETKRRYSIENSTNFFLNQIRSQNYFVKNINTFKDYSLKEHLHSFKEILNYYNIVQDILKENLIIKNLKIRNNDYIKLQEQISLITCEKEISEQLEDSNDKNTDTVSKTSLNDSFISFEDERTNKLKINESLTFSENQIKKNKDLNLDYNTASQKKNSIHTDKYIKKIFSGETFNKNLKLDNSSHFLSKSFSIRDFSNINLENINSVELKNVNLFKNIFHNSNSQTNHRIRFRSICENINPLNKRKSKKSIPTVINNNLNKNNESDNDMDRKENYGLKQEFNNEEISSSYVNDNIDNSEIPNEKINFYYYNFMILNEILKLFNTCNYSSYVHGSSRLIPRFLYLTRFLKEFLQINDSESNDYNNTIIDICFHKFFNFDWLISENIKNKEFSTIIRAEMLNLLLAYLEERGNKLNKEFHNKIYSKINLGIVFSEIKECFDQIFKKYKFDCSHRKDFLRYYSENNEIYNDKYCHLAELYYNLIRRLDPWYQELKSYYPEVTKERKQMNQGLFKNISKAEDQNDENYLNSEKNKKDFIKNNLVYFKLLILLGKEIEVRYKDSNNICNFKKLYFFKSPKCFWLAQSFKDNLIEKIPRKSLGEKLDYLTDKTDKLLFLINLCFNYRPKFFWMGFIFKYFNFYMAELFNYILILFVNIILLVKFTKKSDKPYDSSNLSVEILFGKDSQEMLNKFDFLYFFVLYVIIIEILIFLIWAYFRLHIKVIYLAYKEVSGTYLFPNYKDKSEFLNHSFSKHQEIKRAFEKTDIIKFRNMNLSCSQKIKVIFKAICITNEIKFIVLSLVCHILFLMTIQHIFLIIPIISIINLYDLFAFFWKAMINKYKQFIAILVFIYVVEYIFSWVTFLYYQDFLIGDFVIRDNTVLSQVI